MTNRPPVVFLNLAWAERGKLDGVPLSRDYRLACQFLHCGIMDRTGRLDQGFVYRALDPVPALPAAQGDAAAFAALCDETGEAITAEAIADDRAIEILWSGGIDSTVALIAVLKAVDRLGRRDLLHVRCSLDSVLEHPVFFRERIHGRLPIRPVEHPLSASLDPAVLIVTGEHGDQLFGSQLLAPYVRRGVADVPYQEILPLVLVERLRRVRHIDEVRRYLQPVIDAAPVPIRSLFDYLWWLNFTLKWQEVSLRLAVYTGDRARAVQEATRHFFRGARFQAWAMARSAHRCPPVWARYKDEAKRYIRDHTGDDGYFQTKEKEDSLRNVIGDPDGNLIVRAMMRDTFLPVIQTAPTPLDR